MTTAVLEPDAAPTPTADPPVVDRPAPPAAVRYHAFDALRAGMMLFGIVVHAGLTYSRMPANPIWAVKDAHRTVVADWLFDTSGLFRMPAFFLMAGFFAGLVVDRKGEGRFLWNRARRLVLPFAVGWVVGFPLLRAAFAVASAADGVGVWDAVAAAARAGRLYADPYPIHLWFLEYLLIYCVAGVLLSPLFEPLAGPFRRVAGSPLLVVVGVIATAPILAYSRMGGFGTPLSFTPDPVSLAAYGVFYAVGWGLYAQADRLPGLRRWGWPLLVAGVAAAYFLGGGRGPGGMPRPPEGMPFPPMMGGDGPPGGGAGGFPFPFPPPGTGGGGSPGGMPFPMPGMGPGGPGGGMPFPPMGGGPPPGFGGGSSQGWAGRLPDAAQTALTTWLLTLGLTGVFLFHLNRPAGWAKYIAGASYWLYLAHFPVVAWVALPLRGLDWPGWVKLAVVVGVTVGGLLVPYELVRRWRRPATSPTRSGVT